MVALCRGLRSELFSIGFWRPIFFANSLARKNPAPEERDVLLKPSSVSYGFQIDFIYTAIEGKFLKEYILDTNIPAEKNIFQSILHLI